MPYEMKQGFVCPHSVSVMAGDGRTTIMPRATDKVQQTDTDDTGQSKGGGERQCGAVRLAPRHPHPPFLRRLLLQRLFPATPSSGANVYEYFFRSANYYDHPEAPGN
ncbi:unnamed protein product [Pleuronectes platessa]|uniref:Uncharacterized protein n=1 Tax=Pleuronectes platessa TaxID=8262 RepID=A0A9N7W1B2_PLEPL|nr:unnamed protein product [Pleuronectes platessa]